MRKTWSVLVVLLTLGLGSTAFAGNYVLYLQGRGWNSWDSEVATGAAWQNITLSYNGSSRLDSSATNVTVRNAIATYCDGGNYCVIECFSAGCLRMLKAVSDLRAMGYGLGGLLWSEGAASAAGGTRLAEISTTGWTKYIAKLLGQQEKIDFDLTRSAARGTWGYVQDDLGAMLYHTAGHNNICKKLLWGLVKICGNKYLGGGVGDGAVGIDSASGASTAGAYSDGCSPAKYPYRTYDTDFSPCTGEARDHYGMPGRAATFVAACLNGSSSDANRSWSDATTAPDCDDSQGQCDQPFDSSSQNFSLTTWLSSIAASVAAYSSNTTAHYTNGSSCYGHCGGQAPGGCWCDTKIYGDYCPDYDAANCGTLNGM